MSVNSELHSAPTVPLWVWPLTALMTMCAVNAIPHTVAGLLVLDLPTPFSGGPGTLSSPMVNTLWGVSNVIFAAVLFRVVREWLSHEAMRWSMLAIGIVFAVFLTWAIGSAPLPGRFVG